MTDLRALALAAMDEPDRDHPDFGWADAVDIPTAAEARYIKAASPDVVLALLDERDALRAALGHLAYHVEHVHVGALDGCGEAVMDEARAALAAGSGR